MAWGNLGSSNPKVGGRPILWVNSGKVPEDRRPASLGGEPWAQRRKGMNLLSHSKSLSVSEPQFPLWNKMTTRSPSSLDSRSITMPLHPGSKVPLRPSEFGKLTVVLIRICPQHSIPLPTGSMSVLKTCKQEYVQGPARTVNKRWTQKWQREDTQAQVYMWTRKGWQLGKVKVQSLLCHQPAECPWEEHLPSLGLSFSTYTMKQWDEIISKALPHVTPYMSLSVGSSYKSRQTKRHPRVSTHQENVDLPQKSIIIFD